MDNTATEFRNNDGLSDNEKEKSPMVEKRRVEAGAEEGEEASYSSATAPTSQRLVGSSIRSIVSDAGTNFTPVTCIDSLAYSASTVHELHRAEQVSKTNENRHHPSGVNPHPSILVPEITRENSGTKTFLEHKTNIINYETDDEETGSRMQRTLPPPEAGSMDWCDDTITTLDPITLAANLDTARICGADHHLRPQQQSSDPFGSVYGQEKLPSSKATKKEQSTAAANKSDTTSPTSFNYKKWIWLATLLLVLAGAVVAVVLILLKPSGTTNISSKTTTTQVSVAPTSSPQQQSSDDDATMQQNQPTIILDINPMTPPTNDNTSVPSTTTTAGEPSVMVTTKPPTPSSMTPQPTTNHPSTSPTDTPTTEITTTTSEPPGMAPTNPTTPSPISPMTPQVTIIISPVTTPSSATEPSVIVMAATTKPPTT